MILTNFSLGFFLNDWNVSFLEENEEIKKENEDLKGTFLCT